MKKIFTYSLTLVLIFSLSLSSLIFANNVEHDKKELNSITEKLGDVKDLLTQGQKKEKSLSEQINDLDKKIETTENEIKTIQNNIRKTEGEINETIDQLEETQEEIDGKNDILNARLRVMYKNGEVGLMEILLGSADFQELMSNIDMVKRIYQQDVELLKYLKTKYSEIDLQKMNLEGLKSDLTSQRNNEKTKQGELEVSRGKAAELRAAVEKDNKQLEKQIDDLNEYAKELAEKIREAQSNKEYVGGVLSWPAPGYTRITSKFGYRIHPILKVKKFHTGVDIGVPSNSAVVAANSGVVIHSNWLGGYGKVVMIDHGGGIVTLYAHNNTLLVKAGQQVNKGQAITKSGSTGNSTGPHLHFEVRENGEYVDPMKYFK